MRIALVNIDLGYPIDFWPSKKQSIGIGYIAAILEQSGYSVEILEERFSGYKEIVQILKEKRFDIVGFNFIGLELSYDYLKARTIREAFDNPVTRLMNLVRSIHPKTLIVAGGYSATLWDEEVLRYTPVDIVVRGEGELPMLRLAKARDKKEDLSTTPSISFLDNGVVQRTEEDLIDMKALPKPIRTKHETDNWLMVNSSRGCYGSCTFCSTFSLYGEKKGSWWRGRKASSVIDEITQLYENGFSNIQFADDDFIGTSARRAEKIALGIIDRDLKVKLRFDTRVNNVEKELFVLLKSAGLKRVYLGCESGSQQDLRLFHKKTTLKQNVYAVKLAKSLGIQVNNGIIMFHPLSTVETLADNVAFIEEVEEEPALVQLASKMIVYKGTPLYYQMRAKGILDAPLTNYQIADPAARFVHDEFYKYAEKIQSAIKRKIENNYRSGDTNREAVYQGSDAHLKVFKELLREARK